MASKKIILAIIPLLTIGFTISYANAIENPFDLSMSSEKQIITDTSTMTPRAQMLVGISANQVMCKDGLNLVIKAEDGSPACVKASTIFKLIERGWISMESAFAQEPEPELEIEQVPELEIEQVPELNAITNQLDFLSSKNDRAMYFEARFSEGLIRYTEVVKSNFFKFVPFKEESVGISLNIAPENPIPQKPPLRFMLETIPSKENINYYRAIDDYFQIGSSIFKDFDVSIDVVSGDGTVLLTWSYTRCELDDYVVYLQDNIIYDRFSGEPGPEIRERSIFQCGGLFLEAPED